MALCLLAVLLAAFVACGDDSSSGSASASLPPADTSSSLSGESSGSEEPLGPTLPELPLAMDVNALTGLARPEGLEEGARPVAVMVVNNERALPQRGLAAADVLVEALTEGGVTRLMAMYADYRAVPQVGPVRSTRDQFVQLALPSDAILVHIGTSVYARNLLTVLNYKAIDGIYLGTTSFWFDNDRTLPRPGGKLNEYCWFTDAGLIYSGMELLDVWTTGEVHTLFRFATQQMAPAGDAAYVHVNYSDSAQVSFTYDSTAGTYSKTAFGNLHTDEDGTPLTFTNLILLGCPMGLKPDGTVPEFDMTGGDGWYFTAGGMQPITWQKGDPQAPLRLLDADGNELMVQPGKSYIGVVPAEREGAVTSLTAAEHGG